MIAPKTLQWSAYLIFEDEGYVKDNEKIDADAILKTLKENTEASNAERKRRGWPELPFVGWSIPPAYNATTKRLEWATSLQSQSDQAVNFSPRSWDGEGLPQSSWFRRPKTRPPPLPDLDSVLTGYRFSQGESYAEWRPGDKVAEYGLTGLIVGGAVAAAVKTGLFKGLGSFWSPHCRILEKCWSQPLLPWSLV